MSESTTPAQPWGLHYCKRASWRRTNERDGVTRKLYYAKFSRIDQEHPLAWTEQWVLFWAVSPSAACRAIIESGAEPISFEHQEVN